jgi:hypothetical protein
VAATPIVSFNNGPSAAHFGFGQENWRIQAAQTSIRNDCRFGFEK